MRDRIRINHQIRVPEVRLIGAKGENFGVVTLHEALTKAEAAGLDLIEISPTATPPVAKIADYGKFQYEQNKKNKQGRSKAHQALVKSIQVKIGTGEHDLSLKAKKTSEWLVEGHRVKVDLFLPGRSKYLDKNFLKERLNRVLTLVSTPFKIAHDIEKGPKGLTMIIERDKSK